MANYLFREELNPFRTDPDIKDFLKKSQSILLGRDEFMEWLFGIHNTRHSTIRSYDDTRIAEVAKVLGQRCINMGIDYTRDSISESLKTQNGKDIIVMVDKIGYSNATSLKSVHGKKKIIGTRVAATNDPPSNPNRSWTKGTVVGFKNGISVIDDLIGRKSTYKYLQHSTKQIKRNTVTTSLVRQKMQFVQGFLVSHLGECAELPGIYSVSIICTNKVSPLAVVRGTLKQRVGLETSTKGSILVGAFLYCVKASANLYDAFSISTNEMAILELADSYRNPAGYFAYTKVGFDPDCILYKYNCYSKNKMLPMTANLKVISQSDIVGYITGKHPRHRINDPFNFHLLASIDKVTQAEMAKKLSDIIEYYGSTTKQPRKLDTLVMDYMNEYEQIRQIKKDLPKLVTITGAMINNGEDMFQSTILPTPKDDSDSS